MDEEQPQIPRNNSVCVCKKENTVTLHRGSRCGTPSSTAGGRAVPQARSRQECIVCRAVFPRTPGRPESAATVVGSKRQAVQEHVLGPPLAVNVRQGARADEHALQTVFGPSNVEKSEVVRLVTRYVV